MSCDECGSATKNFLCVWVRMPLVSLGKCQKKKNCPEPLNLESQSTWWCQWSTLNVQWLCMIIWTWVLSSWRFSAVNEIWTRDRSSKRNVWIIIGRSVPRAYLSSFFSSQLWSVWFLSSARRFWTITRGSKVSSSRTDLEEFSDFPMVEVCPRESLEYVAPLVLMRLSIWASCLMSSSVSAPFSMARRSVNCDLLFYQWGVRAKQRNVEITEKVMIFWVRSPAPRSLISWTVSSRLISFESSHPRASAQLLSSLWGVFVTDHYSIP